MVEGPHGAGLAYLPRHPRELLPRLTALAKQSLRQLAALATSWDPLETALGGRRDQRATTIDTIFPPCPATA